MSFSRILCALSIAILSSASLAQSITDVEAKPYGSYTGSSIDTVDLVTGNLMLHIPLLSYPQKGTLPPLTFSVELNNAPYNNSGGTNGDGQFFGPLRYDTAPPGGAYQQNSNPSYNAGFEFQMQGAYITSSFSGGIVIGQSDYDGGGPVFAYNLIDPDGTTHELESDTSSPNTYRTPDGSGYTFLPSDSGPTNSQPNGGNAYDSANSDNLGMGSTESSVYSPSASYWLYVPPSYGSSFSDYASGSGVRLGNILTSTGISYSSRLQPFSMSAPVFSTDANTCNALTTTATDPTGNSITRSLWYWSGCADENWVPDIKSYYAGSFPSGYPTGYYTDSVGRIIPDILSTEATLNGETTSQAPIPWTVPGPGGNPLTYYLQYNHIYNSDYTDTETCEPSCAQTWNGLPDPSVAFSGDTYQGAALASITLPGFTNNANEEQGTGQFQPGVWQFIYSPQGLGQTNLGDPVFDGYTSDQINGARTGPDLWQVITPTGGEIDYTYTTIEEPSTTEDPMAADVAWSRCSGNCHAVYQRTVKDGHGNSYTTTYTYGNYTSGQISNTICPSNNSYAIWTKETDSLGNDTVHSFCLLTNSAGTSQYHEVETQYFQGSASLPNSSSGFVAASGAQPLKTVTTQWQYEVDIAPPGGAAELINVLPTTVVTTTPGGSTTEVKGYSSLFSSFRAYCDGCSTTSPTTSPGWWPESGDNIAISYLSPTSDVIYPGSSATGNSLRNTTTTFEFQQGSSAYTAANVNMVGLPIQEQNLDSNGALLSQTTYCYDTVTSNCGNIQQNLIGGEPKCGNGSSQPCGDLTATTQWLNTGTSVTTTTAYVQGMPVLKTDGNGNQTSITYQCQGMYPQTVTKAFGSTTTLPETTSYTYDCASNLTDSAGVVTGVTDPNGVNTTYSYALSGDSLGRLTQVVVNTSGAPTEQSTTTLSYPWLREVDVSQEQSPSVSLTSKTVYDGLGRTIWQMNPAGYATATTYGDESTRPYTVTNPSPVGGSPTDGTTTYAYDALGRVVMKANQNSTTAWWCYDSVPYVSVLPSWTNSQPTSSGAQLCSFAGTGNSWVNSMDESGNPHQQSYDGLGQLIAVTEPNPATGSMTSNALGTAYTYDGLGNLTKVVQSGLSPEAARTRTFTYDSLSRLTCASNPENSTAACPTTATSTYTAGTTGYIYDSDGNVSSKTDARGVTISYFYDGLNRLLSKTYGTASTTPAACYQYDQASVQTGGGNVTIKNPIGHLTAEWTQTGGCPSPVQLPASGTLTSRLLLGYDFMGRLTNEQQCTSSTCSTPYNLSYSYDLAGHVTQANNGIGTIAWQPQYDSAGRLSGVTGVTPWTDPQFPSNLFNAVSYGPAGITSWQMPALTFTKNYDSRFRVTNETVTGNQRPQ